MHFDQPIYSISELIPARHDRGNFDCGVCALNRYLQEQASQDMKRRAAGCWVLVESQAPDIILGFYTLSPEGIESQQVPELSAALRKKLPKYKRLGAVLLGRLAVDKNQQGKRLGERLLFDAFHRVHLAEIPSVLMVADPKDGNAEAFYRKYGFQRLTAERMFIPMVSVSTFLQSVD